MKKLSHHNGDGTVTANSIWYHTLTKGLPVLFVYIICHLLSGGMKWIDSVNTAVKREVPQMREILQCQTTKIQSLEDKVCGVDKKIDLLMQINGLRVINKDKLVYKWGNKTLDGNKKNY